MARRFCIGREGWTHEMKKISWFRCVGRGCLVKNLPHGNSIRRPKRFRAKGRIPLSCLLRDSAPSRETSFLTFTKVIHFCCHHTPQHLMSKLSRVRFPSLRSGKSSGFQPQMEQIRGGWKPPLRRLDRHALGSADRYRSPGSVWGATTTVQTPSAVSTVSHP